MHPKMIAAVRKHSICVISCMGFPQQRPTWHHKRDTQLYGLSGLFRAAVETLHRTLLVLKSLEENVSLKPTVRCKQFLTKENEFHYQKRKPRSNSIILNCILNIRTIEMTSGWPFFKKWDATLLLIQGLSTKKVKLALLLMFVFISHIKVWSIVLKPAYLHLYYILHMFTSLWWKTWRGEKTKNVCGKEKSFISFPFLSYDFLHCCLSLGVIHLPSMQFTCCEMNRSCCLLTLCAFQRAYDCIWCYFFRWKSKEKDI